MKSAGGGTSAAGKIPNRFMTIQTINPQSTGIEAAALALMTTAFADDPAVRWMYPEPQQYQDHFPNFIEAFAGKAFECGTVNYSPDFTGAALWLPPHVQPDEAVVAGVLQRSVAEEKLPEVFSLLEQMGTFHPTEPHWYLPMLGVGPGNQGRGIGSTLLAKAIARCDREYLPAYLESTNPRNISLYERFGFSSIGRIQTQSSPPIIPMLRPPRL
jgi:ribosomal protein S18 acetylase RimI-like enzyme